MHTEVVPIAWAFGFKNLRGVTATMPIAGMPFDHARNTACRVALEQGFDYLFFLDSDVIPPSDTIERLIARGQPLISGVYCRRSPPHGVPVMMRPVGQWVTQLPGPGEDPIIEVDVVGAGCLLIRSDLLRSFAQPQRPGKHWFDWRVDMHGILPHHQCLSEDFTFCTHAKSLGYRVLVDTSIRCRHVGLAQADYGSLHPVENAA